MRGFVFDVDNTIFDRYSTLSKILSDNFDTVRPYLNIAYNLERATEHLIHTESLFIIEDWENVYNHLKSEYFFNASKTPSFKKFWGFIHDNFMKTAVEFSFIKPMLSELRKAGYKLGIITNGLGDIQRAKLEVLGLTEYVDEILVSGEYAHRMCGNDRCLDYWKPGELIFEEMAKKMECPPSELYYVGDNPQNDIIPARNAGFVPVWIMSKSPWPYANSQLPEHCFETAQGILSLI